MESKTPIGPGAESYGSMLVELIDTLKQLWRTILAVFTIMLVVGIVGILLWPKTYTAEMVLIPNSETAGQGSGGMAKNLGGLASLAGINLDSDSDIIVDQGLAIILSRQFAEMLIREHNLSEYLIEQQGGVRNDSDSESSSESTAPITFVSEWGRPPNDSIKNLWDAYSKYLDVVAVDRDKETGFVRLKVTHYSASVAKDLASIIYLEINSWMRAKAIDKYSRNIEYLENQMKKISSAEIRLIFSQIIEEQTKKIMLAEAQPEYLFEVVDPAVEPKRENGPDILVKLLMLIVFSLGMSVVGAMTIKILRG